MSIEDLEAELDRRKHDVAVRRQIQNQIQSLPSIAERGQSRVSGVNVRGLNGLQPSWDQDEVTGASATMDSTKSQNSVSHSHNSRESDSPVQTAWGQDNEMPSDTNQQVNKSDQSRQLATQLALSAGPGNMFPILSGFTFKRPDNDKIVPVGMSFDSTGNGRTEFAGKVKIEKGKADDSSRPYDGTWPNSTNPSTKQNLNATFKGGMSEAFETSSLNSQSRNGSFSKLNAATSNQTSEMSSLWTSNSPSAKPSSSGSSTGQWPNSNSAVSAPAKNSAPQWPFSSNR